MTKRNTLSGFVPHSRISVYWMNKGSISIKKTSYNTKLNVDEFPIARRSRGNSLSDNLRKSFRGSRVS